jgi:hypothetical protein
VAVSELITCIPSLNSFLRPYRQSVVRASLRASGYLRDLSVQQLEAAGLGSTRINASGRISGLPNLNRTAFDLRCERLEGTAGDLKNLLPKGTLPSSINVPAQFSGSGNFRGTLDNFTTAWQMRTSQGDFDCAGSMQITAKAYSLEAKLRGLELGYLLQMDSVLGKFTGQVSAKGRGYDYKSMQASAHAKVESGWYRGYEYRDLSVTASSEKGKARLQANMEDSNIRFHLEGSADVRLKFPAVKLDLQLDSLNMQALHWIKDSIVIGTHLMADFASTDPNGPEGTLVMRDLRWTDSSHHVRTDSLILVAARTDSLQDIRLHGEMVDMEWKGVYKITEAGVALNSTLKKYYASTLPDTISYAPQNWQFRLRMHPSPLVLAFVPALKGSDSIRAYVGFNSEKHSLHLDLRAPRIGSEHNVIHELSIGADTRDNALHYLVEIEGAEQDGFHLYETSLYGILAHDQLLASVLARDSAGKKRYLLQGKLMKPHGGFRFSFIPDSLLLNYDKWQMTADNYLVYDSTGLLVHNMVFSRNDQSLGFNSAGTSGESPLVGSFRDFQLRTISIFLNQDSLQVDGILNGRINVHHLLSKPVFTSDLKIAGLTYEKDTLGNLQIKVDNLKENLLAAHVSLVGPFNDIKMDGSYTTTRQNVDINIAIRKFDLVVVKALSMGQVRDIRGLLKGNLHFSGSFLAPVLEGDLQFENARVTPALSGEPLKISADQVRFEKGGLHLRNVILTDSAGNRATVNGTVLTNDYKDFRVDLTARATDFRVINAPQAVNRIYFGKLVMNADLRIRGDIRAPRVNADLRVNRQTDFTLILPSDDPEEVSREGVVVFRSREELADTANMRRIRDSAARGSSVRGMDVSATIETDSNARFTLIVDERNGDALTIRGRADLAGGIDRSGRMTLTGNYELDAGAYSLTLSVLKRRFDITRGSTMTWTGDPSTALLDINATYTVNAAPIDLVQQQIAGMSQTEMNKYRQKLPFTVHLKMRGELLKPIISFDITLPTYLSAAWPDVVNRLMQVRTNESEMNKQVFALLLLNQFAPESPFAGSGTGYDAGIIARQSVSSLLSQQLNNLAGSLIRGVDMDFNFNSSQDYSTGQAQTQTELNVAVSKKLFNDRVNVRVGSNFQLENVLPGQAPANIAGDIRVDYLLSRDGRYTLRAFRKDQYNTIVQGQVVETGLSFILTFDYDKFRELFQKTKSKDTRNQTKGSAHPDNSQ